MKTSYFINNYELYGNDDYITDGNILISKKAIATDVYIPALNLKRIYHRPDIFDMKVIPQEAGEPAEFTKGARRRPHKHKCLKFNKYYFDYEYIELFNDLFDVDHYTVVKMPEREKWCAQAILKLWDEDDKFLGCISNVDFKEKTNDR